jgi:putative sigma-54 modulation protein
MRAHVILSSEKRGRRAKIELYWRDTVFTGDGENENVRQAVSIAAEKVRKQVLKLKEKFQTRKRGRAPIKEVAPVPGGALEAAPSGPRIVAARRYRVKPLTPADAAVLLADSDDQFIVFRDAETDRVGVLYHRSDGNYGLIEP